MHNWLMANSWLLTTQNWLLVNSGWLLIGGVCGSMMISFCNWFFSHIAPVCDRWRSDDMMLLSTVRLVGLGFLEIVLMMRELACRVIDPFVPNVFSASCPSDTV